LSNTHHSRKRPSTGLRTTHGPQPFALVLHLHQHQSSRNLHLQYSVTTLSITHHTRKRPSTSTQTTHGSQRVASVGALGVRAFVPMHFLVMYKCSHICTSCIPPGSNVESRGVSGAYSARLVQMPSFVPRAKIHGTNKKSCQGQMPDSLVVPPHSPFPSPSSLYPMEEMRPAAAALASKHRCPPTSSPLLPFVLFTLLTSSTRNGCRIHLYRRHQQCEVIS
jgi:hypothetical protein